MSRLRRIEPSGRYFFVTTNLARGVPELTPKERGICIQQLNESRAKHSFALFAYVVMPNHGHILMATFESSLADIMRDWKGRSGWAIAKERNTRGSIWQRRYFDFILRRASDFGKKFEYIHDNPVSAGLVVQPEDWLWSSAAFYVKKNQCLVRPDVFNIPADPNELLWPAPWR